MARFSGVITTEDVVAAQDDFEWTLLAIRRGGCLLLDGREVRDLEPTALGSLLYYAPRVKEAAPGLVLLLGRLEPPSVPLRRHVRRVLSEELRLCTSAEEAAAALREAYPDAPPLDGSLDRAA